MTGILPAAKPRRLRRAAAGVAVFAAAGVAVVAVGHAVTARPQADASTTTEVPTGSAPVVRGTATQTVKVSGTLGFDGSYRVANLLGDGVVTAAADPGTTVARGAVLYAVANRPVRLLYGTVPAYRDFAAGMPDGPDVRELEENLVALGIDPGHTVTVDDHFTSATAAAIRRWQAGNGLPVAQRTGALDQGEVVFLPGAVRVSTADAGTGAIGRPGCAGAVRYLDEPGGDRAADRPTGRSLVHPGDQVRVSITGTAAVTGTVAGSGGWPVGGHRPGQRLGRSGRPGWRTGHVTVTITFTLPSGVGDLDQAPVQVSITAASPRDVLLVPVTALLARAGGGYQVRLSDGRVLAVTARAVRRRLPGPSRSTGEACTRATASRYRRRDTRYWS